MPSGNGDIQSLFESRLRRNASTTIWTGVLIAIAGIVALSAPMLVGASVGILVGILLLIGGIGQLVFAYQSGAGVWPWVLGLLTLIAGGYMAGNLAVAAATLTIVLTLYLFVSGFADIVFALQLRPFDGWGFFMASGVLSVVLGVLIWSQFPLSGPFAIGIFLGVKLLASGLLLVYLGTTARRLAKTD